MLCDPRPDVVLGSDGSTVSCAADAECGHLLALTMLPRMGPRRLHNLVSRWGSCAAWDRIVSGQDVVLTLPAGVLQGWRRTAPLIDPEQTISHHRAADVRWDMRGSARYPVRLSTDPEPPEILFWRGDMEVLARPTVGIVGTRNCTRYGRDVAFELGRELGRAGVAVVSGLALGIDAAAHAGTLDGDGVPVAVVGGGVDVIYPRRNAGLWDQVVASGLLLTEQAMGIAPQRWMFPARNRIIAGLADVVVVVESPLRGGSMYTVDAALDRDRPVFAVPGPIRNVASEGTNRLLADGAHPYCAPSDVLEALGLITTAAGSTPARAEPAVCGEDEPGDQRLILDAFAWQPQTLDRLVGSTGLTAPVVAVQLELLVAAGRVVSRGGWYERTARRVNEHQ